MLNYKIPCACRRRAPAILTYLKQNVDFETITREHDTILLCLRRDVQMSFKIVLNQLVFGVFLHICCEKLWKW